MVSPEIEIANKQREIRLNIGKQYNSALFDISNMYTDIYGRNPREDMVYDRLNKCRIKQAEVRRRMQQWKG